MDLIRCPRCGTTVERVPGVMPVCPRCGYGKPTATPAYPVQPPPPAPAAYAQAPPQAGYPPLSAPAPYAQGTPPPRPGMVTAAGVLGIIQASVLALLGLAVALFSRWTWDTIVNESPEPLPPELLEAGPAFVVAFGLIMVALAGFFLFVALQTLKGRNWARITMVVFAGLGALGLLLDLSLDAVTLGQAAADIFVLVALLAPTSSAWFREMKARRNPYR